MEHVISHRYSLLNFMKQYGCPSECDAAQGCFWNYCLACKEGFYPEQILITAGPTSVTAGYSGPSYGTHESTDSYETDDSAGYTEGTGYSTTSPTSMDTTTFFTDYITQSRPSTAPGSTNSMVLYRCHLCARSCKACTGPTYKDCTKCHNNTGNILVDGQCVGSVQGASASPILYMYVSAIIALIIVSLVILYSTITRRHNRANEVPCGSENVPTHVTADLDSTANGSRLELCDVELFPNKGDCLAYGKWELVNCKEY